MNEIITGARSSVSDILARYTAGVLSVHNKNWTTLPTLNPRCRLLCRDLDSGAEFFGDDLVPYRNSSISCTFYCAWFAVAYLLRYISTGMNRIAAAAGYASDTRDVLGRRLRHSSHSLRAGMVHVSADELHVRRRTGSSGWQCR